MNGEGLSDVYTAQVRCGNYRHENESREKGGA